MRTAVGKFVTERWVSWTIELAVLSIVAYFTISETRKTAEQTRAMLEKYDAAISAYAEEKTQTVDAAVVSAYEAARAKAGSVTREDLIKALEALKSEEKER